MAVGHPYSNQRGNLMKKVLSLVLILSLVLGLGLMFTGCGKGEPYSKYDLSEYITLPDYNKFEVKIPEVNVTDAEVEAQIQKNLEAAATTETVKEGTVAKGDTIVIKFAGTLEDGTTSDGMKSDSYTLTLGSGTMIDGFEAGLYGATIGKEVTLDLKFPNPYANNPDLAGKGVTFKVTVLSKQVKIVPTLTEEFVKKNSDSKTVAEYRVAVGKVLEQAKYDEELYKIKFDLYSKIIEETKVLKYPDKEVKAQTKEVTEVYKEKAKAANKKWADYLKDELKLSEEEFTKEATTYAKELVKQEMIIYAIAEKENLTVTEKEYDTYLQTMLTSSGFANEEAFKNYTGMTLKEYAEAYKLDRDLLLTKELDVIYERLSETDK